MKVIRVTYKKDKNDYALKVVSTSVLFFFVSSLVLCRVLAWLVVLGSTVACME